MTKRDPNDDFTDEEKARGLGRTTHYGGSAYVASTGRIDDDFHKAEVYAQVDPPRGQQPALSPSATPETYEELSEAEKAHEGLPNVAAGTLYPNRYGETREGDDELTQEAHEQAEKNAKDRAATEKKAAEAAAGKEKAAVKAAEARSGSHAKR